MSKTQYLAALKKLGLTPYSAAPILGIGRRQSHRYADGSQPIKETVALLLAQYLEHGFTANQQADDGAPEHKSKLFHGATMIKTPYNFEAILSDLEFQKIGQFACRWALIEHTIGNCLRAMLEMEPEQATVMIFPLSLDNRMARISELSRLHSLTEYQLSLFVELKPLIKAMQFLRTTTLHGIVMSAGDEDEDRTYFHLRSKNRNMSRKELLSCEDLINYAAHVTQAFRLSLGDKDYPGHTYALPDRPPIPEFLPPECRAFPKESMGGPLGQPKASPD